MSPAAASNPLRFLLLQLTKQKTYPWLPTAISFPVGFLVFKLTQQKTYPWLPTAVSFPVGFLRLIKMDSETNRQAISTKNSLNTP